MTKVNFSYNFGTEKYSKEVWLCSHLGTRTNGSLSGDYLESAELLASVSETIGTSTIDVGLVAPIKKDFMSGSMIDLKIGATTCPGYIATQIALDNMVRSLRQITDHEWLIQEKPNVKIVYTEHNIYRVRIVIVLNCMCEQYVSR